MLNSGRSSSAKHSEHAHLFTVAQDCTRSTEPVCNYHHLSVPGGKPTHVYQAGIPVYGYCAQLPCYLLSGQI